MKTMDGQQESLFASAVMGFHGEKPFVMAIALLWVWKIPALLWISAMMPLGNTFCCVHSVLNTNTVCILLISDDMTVSVRGMKRHPERCWQKYWCRRNYIGNTEFPVCSRELVLLLCCITACTRVFGVPQWCLLVQCDKTLLLQMQQKQCAKAQRNSMPKIETTPSVSQTWTIAQFFSTGKKSKSWFITD